MAAITKAWVSVADAAVDPDSPLDTTLMTALRDDLINLREWLGAGFTAGAVQDHNHDGVNSALVPVGPNQLRNGSFEAGEAGWTFTDFTGGSHAISSANHAHGASAAQITSTVLANGGGEATHDEYIPISDGDTLALKFWIWASVANVSSKLEIIWYDNSQAQISATAVANYTNTPTTATFHKTTTTAPSNTRYYRLRITGGVPASGAAVGTVRFDGIEATGAIVQGLIRTATASGSVTGAAASYTLTGGTYSWWTGSANNAHGMQFGNGDTGPGVIGLCTFDGASETFFVDERYIQASPPYNLGDGDIPHFIMALVAGDGSLRGISVAPEPTWAYNGPTDIRPERIEAGRPLRRYRELEGKPLHEALKIAAARERFLKEESQVELVEREITHAVKNADIALFPHPWAHGNELTSLSVIMLDPFSRLLDRLSLISEDQGAREVRKIIEGGYIQIGNTPLPLNAPPGVMPVAASWKLTR